MNKANRIFWSTTLFFVIFMGACAYAQGSPEKTAPLQRSKMPQKNIQAGPGATAKEKHSAQKPAASQPTEPSVAPKEEALDFKDPFQAYFPFTMKKVSKELPQTPETKIKKDEKDKFDPSSLDVTGIVWGTDKPKAIINDEVLGVGALVEGAEILNISKEGILLKYKDEEYLIKRGKEKTEGKDKKSGQFIQGFEQKKKPLQKK